MYDNNKSYNCQPVSDYSISILDYINELINCDAGKETYDYFSHEY